MALSTLADLVSEVRDEMDDSAFSADRIYNAVARAEAVFNRSLRTPRMETETTLTVTGEQTSLPTDFLSMRAIYQEGSPDRLLRSMSPAALRSLYFGQSGTPAAYAIERRTLVVAPVGDANLKMLYYARVPALTVSAPTNWLLTDHPDLYLHQVLAVLYNKISDSDRAALNLSIAGDILAEVNRSAQQNRWGAGPLVPRGIAQTYGARI